MSVFFHISDRMAEIMKIEVDVKDSEITSTVEETCLVNIHEYEAVQYKYARLTVVYK